ncbi:MULTISPECIES: hypothetical protein [Moorena]|uniref:Uncharacterized protein n=1 Tax=Moorena producens (strain JHB) TaxID=1454205 RepID=A0A9Q9UVI9_MOOP1|nr:MULTISPECIES: hypothetical protein [Moorena]NEP36075.1 hypothetical protein [Moorena sp. SIO3B2]WAN68886.1 hypothetical protein BJP36_41725 [Moorena producens JHB]
MTTRAFAAGASQCMLFDPVGGTGILPMVRYGPGSLNRCQEGENQGEPVPNAPYASCLLPLASCLLPLASCLLPFASCL